MKVFVEGVQTFLFCTFFVCCTRPFGCRQRARLQKDCCCHRRVYAYIFPYLRHIATLLWRLCVLLETFLWFVVTDLEGWFVNKENVVLISGVCHPFFVSVGHR
jgi:hypothetical protein